MQLGYVDRVAARAARHQALLLPRDRGESKSAYARRFFSEIRGLGNVLIVTKRGSRCTTRSVRHY